MEKNQIASHYNKTSGEWFKDTTKEPNKYYYSMYFKELFNKAGKNEKAIDIGCGGGIFTIELAKQGYKKVYGIDFSNNMVKSLDKQIKQRKIKNITVKQSDVEKLPFKSKHFDFLIGVGVLECLRTPQNALREIYRILRAEGKASLRFANDESIWEALENFKKFIGKPTDPHFTRHYRMDYISFELKKLGFRITNVTGTVLFPLFLLPKWLERILDLILIRTKLAYFLENITYKNIFFVKKFYYSYVVKVQKI